MICRLIGSMLKLHSPTDDSKFTQYVNPEVPSFETSADTVASVMDCSSDISGANSEKNLEDTSNYLAKQAVDVLCSIITRDLNSIERDISTVMKEENCTESFETS